MALVRWVHADGSPGIDPDPPNHAEHDPVALRAQYGWPEPPTDEEAKGKLFCPPCLNYIYGYEPGQKCPDHSMVWRPCSSCGERWTCDTCYGRKELLGASLAFDGADPCPDCT